MAAQLETPQTTKKVSSTSSMCHWAVAIDTLMAMAVATLDGRSVRDTALTTVRSKDADWGVTSAKTGGLREAGVDTYRNKLIKPTLLPRTNGTGFRANKLSWAMNAVMLSEMLMRILALAQDGLPQMIMGQRIGGL